MSKKNNNEKKVIEESSEKPLGILRGTLYGIGCGIGGSIFILLGTAVETAGPGVLISLGLGGLLIFLTALNYSELSTSIPYSGGAYNFSKEALGGLLAYIVGFFLWLANIGTCVFSSMAFALVINQIFTINVPLPLFGVIATLLITITNFRNQDVAIKSLLWLTVVFIAIFIFFTLSGIFIAPFTNPQGYQPSYLLSDFTAFGVIQMFSLLFISYTSITSNLAHLNPILKNRAKNAPRVNMLAIGVTAVIYLIMTSVVLINIGGNSSGLTGTPILLADVLGDILGPFGFYLMGAAAIITTVIAINAALGSATNVLQALARDNYVTDRLQKVNKKRNMPVYSLAVTTAVSITITILVNSNIDLAANMTSFIYFFGLAFVNFAAVSLRYKRKELDRPFKAPFFPLLPIIVGIICLVLSFILSDVAIIVGILMLLIGFAYYLLKIADRYSIVLTLAGIKACAIVFVTIIILIINNFGTISTTLPGGEIIFNDILIRILIFFGVVTIITVIFDLIPLREVVYFFVRKIDKDKIAISIGEGQIIELQKKQIKLIYFFNIFLGIIQVFGSLFVILLSILIYSDIINIVEIGNISFNISQAGSELIVISSFLILGVSLFFSALVQIYYTRELKTLGV
ncbi:MAG: amino acid permease [Candidatus Lokiarchaeota archaeon]|nr:amino acid permease [Candidatus Lokiarchaeota archaeon]MBD3199523.1 amino acid permease [Candidatus Lokiarchaeota archaeon]